jgi:hypothetical protein
MPPPVWTWYRACAPLFIDWLKPETKRSFRRET